MYYKVVSCDLKSARSARDMSDFCVQYQIGQWVYPTFKGSKCFVFDNLINARNFKRVGNSGEKIFQAEVLRPTKRCKVFSQLCPWTTLREIWRLRKNKKKFTHILGLMDKQPPKGTVWVDAVKLIKQVK